MNSVMKKLLCILYSIILISVCAGGACDTAADLLPPDMLTSQYSLPLSGACLSAGALPLQQMAAVEPGSIGPLITAAGKVGSSHLRLVRLLGLLLELLTLPAICCRTWLPGPNRVYNDVCLYIHRGRHPPVCA